MALRIDLNATCKCCSSSATWIGFELSAGMSSSICTSSRHDIACMSSTSDRRGVSKLPENMLIFMFKIYTKVRSNRMTIRIV